MGIFVMFKESVTARDAAEFYGLEGNRHGMACCPFHDDKNPSMKIDKRFYCFGCGAKGDAIDYAERYFGLEPKAAAEKICEDFGIKYGGKSLYRSPPQKTKPRKNDEQIFKETCAHCFRVLCDYLQLLEQWKIEYAPKDETKEWHPYFCEALREIDHVNYLLDILLDGDVHDRAFLVSDYGRKVKNIEERIRKIDK